MQDVTDHRTGRAGDNTDHCRHMGDRLFAFGVKQPLGGKAPAAFFQLAQHRTLASHLHGLHDDLVFRAPAIDCQLASDDNLQPLFRLHGKRAGDSLPADPVKGIPVILQGEIEMSRGGTGGTRNLGSDPHEIKLTFNGRLQPLRQFGHRQEGRCVRTCLGVGRGGYIWIHTAGPLSWRLHLMPYCAPGKPQRPAPERRTI